MDTVNLERATLDDIVFSGRNKSYGAYLLRKIYDKHVTISTFIAIMIFLLLVSMPLIAKFIKGEEPPTPPIVQTATEVLVQPPPLEENTPPPPPPPKDLPPPPPPKREQVKFTPPVVKKDKDVQVQEKVPDVEELEGVDIGAVAVEGVKGIPMDLAGIEGGTGNAIVAEIIDDTPYEYVEQKPEFPGGEKAMLQYLGKNIRYPAAATRAGIEGMCVLSFVVSRTGEISDIQIIKNLGAGTGEEAVRVVKTMPKWSPGKQNGRAVPVRYTLPVRYTIK